MAGVKGEFDRSTKCQDISLDTCWDFYLALHYIVECLLPTGVINPLVDMYTQLFLDVCVTF